MASTTWARSSGSTRTAAARARLPLNSGTFPYTILNDPLGTKGTERTGINDYGPDRRAILRRSSGRGHGFLYSGGTYTTLDDPLGTTGTARLRHQRRGPDRRGVLGQQRYGARLPIAAAAPTPRSTIRWASRARYANGINDAGQIVGVYEDSSGTNTASFTAAAPTPRSTIRWAPTAPLLPASTTSGQIVGYYYGQQQRAHGFLYSDGTYTTLDDPLGTRAPRRLASTTRARSSGPTTTAAATSTVSLPTLRLRRRLRRRPRSSKKSLAFMRRSTTALPITSAFRFGSTPMASNLTLAE